MKLRLKFLSGTKLECELRMQNPTLGDLKAELAKLMAKQCFADLDPFCFLGQEVKNKALKNSTLLSNIVSSNIKLVYAGLCLSNNEKYPNETLLSHFKLQEGTVIHVTLMKQEPNQSPASLLQQSFKTLLGTACQYGTNTVQKALRDEQNEEIVKGATEMLDDHIQYKRF